MDYWILYALGLTGLLAWWANKERSKGLVATVTTEDDKGGKDKPKSLPLLPGLDGIKTTAPLESYTRGEFEALANALTSTPDFKTYYEPPASADPKSSAEHALGVWNGTESPNATEDRVDLAIAFRTAAHDGRLASATRSLFERGARMLRYAAISGDTVDPKKTMAEIDTAFAMLDASLTGKPIPTGTGGGGGGTYEALEDTIKSGTYTREKFSTQLDALLASPEIASELVSTDAATGVVVNQAPTVRANSLKIWDEGPTAARAAFAIDDYAAGRGVEPQPDATNTTVVWVKSGTPTSKTDPFSPAVSSQLVDLAMMMRWRAVSEAASSVDAENTRAAIDEVFSRIDAAAA